MEKLQQNWWALLLEGIVLTILGFFAIMLPQFSTISMALILAVILIVSGIAQTYKAIKIKGEKHFWPSILSGVMGIVIGTLMMVYPLKGAFVLSVFLITYLSFEAIFKMIVAQLIRPLSQWLYFFISSIVTFGIIFMILASWPISSFLLLGLFLGINMVTFGLAMILTSYELKTMGSGSRHAH